MDMPPAPDEDEGVQRPAAAGSLLRTLTGPQVSVALGIGILLAVLANRIATPELVDSQARTDILGVIASGGLITNGVYLLVRFPAWPVPRHNPWEGRTFGKAAWSFYGSGRVVLACLACCRSKTASDTRVAREKLISARQDASLFALCSAEIVSVWLGS